MKLMFSLGHACFYDGGYYSPGGIYTYHMLEESYVDGFDRGVLVLRSRSVDQIEASYTRLDGPLVEVCPIPPLTMNTLLRLPHLIWSISRTARLADRYLVRLPCPSGFVVAVSLLLSGRRYGVELAGHATESLEQVWTQQGKKHPLLAKSINGLCRWLVRWAVAVGYRSRYLQRQYPRGDPNREFIFSGARLHQDVIGMPRTVEQFSREPFTLVSIGRLNPEKGHQVLLEAFGLVCRRTSIPIRLRIVGDGTSRQGLIRRAEQLGLADRCEFPGLLPWGQELFATMDDAHLFVLPSLTEGMPRALIEAMARGMPALGSDCGGIPELLAPDDLLPPGNVEALADKILEVVENRSRLVEMSHRNFVASQEHWPQRLAVERQKFWDLVKRDAK